jgi:hypothetical protein
MEPAMQKVSISPAPRMRAAMGTSAILFVLATTGPATAGSIDCINAKGIETITAVDPSTLKVRMFNRMTYRNEVTGRCVANRAARFNFKAKDGQLCSGATVTAIGTRTSCTLGSFQEISPRSR